MRFSLILATVGRTDTLRCFLDTLLSQTHKDFELIVVDQNSDERLVSVLAPYMSTFPILHLQSVKGLSRARNTGLRHSCGDLIAFPDDDCEYPPNLLSRVTEFFIRHPEMDGLTGRITDETTNFGIEPNSINKRNVWSCASSISIFLRRDSTQGVWFDEGLGLGSSTRWQSGEETEYLLQLLERGALLHYDPDLIVIHPSPVAKYDRSARRRAYRYGCGMGRVLRMHNYPLWFVLYQWTRPLGGLLLALGRREIAKAGYHWAIFRGRAVGWIARFGL